VLFEGITRVVRGDTLDVAGRLPYDSADLTAIFGSEAFSKLTGAKRWVPLTATLSGCRVEEAAGLRVQDVRKEGSVWFFDFVPTVERRLKNEASRARTPVHPELIRLGLVEYVRSVPQSGRLFPELKPGAHGKLSGAFGKWFSRFVDERGVKDPRKAPLHSLRHLFKGPLSSGRSERGTARRSHTPQRRECRASVWSRPKPPRAGGGVEPSGVP
jgi:integrase